MSYARFGWEDSDVYVYLDVGGYLTCCACSFDRHAWPKFTRTDDLLAHLSDHDEAGHRVPPETILRLVRDRKENDGWIAAYASASDETRGPDGEGS